MRFFGGILCWIVPDRIIEEVTSEDNLVQDLMSNFIATALTSFLGWRLVGLLAEIPSKKALLVVEIFVAPLGPFIANLVILAAFTWALAYIIGSNDIQIGGQSLQPSFEELFPCHLHAWAILMMAVFLGLVTRNPILLLVMGLVILRTVDIEARIIRQICAISLVEAYKVVAFIFGIMIAGIGIAALCIKFLG